MSDLASLLSFSSCFLAQLAVLRHDGKSTLDFPKESFQFGPARQILGGRPLDVYPPAVYGSSFATFARWKAGPCSPALQLKTSDESTGSTGTIRIGIVGGGIAGVSVARALMKRLPPSEDDGKKYTITIYEGDSNGGAGHHHDNNHRPQWIAATARNANSIVPGVAMHVFSRPSVLWDVFQDTVSEWFTLKKQRLESSLRPSLTQQERAARQIHAFAVPPPYFALHLYRCLGPSASQEERISFVRFCSRFLYAALWLGNDAADERAKHVCDLAKSNRALFLNEMENYPSSRKNSVGPTQGFISVHRSLDAAKAAMDEIRNHGMPAELLDWDTAVQREPRLSNIPFKPLYAAFRPDDHTASCNTFIRDWIDETIHAGARYCFQKVKRLKHLPDSKLLESASTNNGTYVVTTEDGEDHEFDMLVIAAGVQSPILASDLGIGKHCPTYPLRGYSLSAFFNDSKQREQNSSRVMRDGQQYNALHHPFSIDSMHCTSVTPTMTRWAGFGEFVGYRDKANSVHSVAPAVLSRYARAIFPDAINIASDQEYQEALPCFRPMSPDDLPICGEVENRPNLFLHTGHGTLGWTLGLATGECVAQAMAENILLERRKGNHQNPDHEQSGSTTVISRRDQGKEQFFDLPNGTKIERYVLSPNRFS